MAAKVAAKVVKAVKAVDKADSAAAPADNEVVAKAGLVDKADRVVVSNVRPSRSNDHDCDGRGRQQWRRSPCFGIMP